MISILLIILLLYFFLILLSLYLLHDFFIIYINVDIKPENSLQELNGTLHSAT